MRGQVLEKQNETLVVCVGQADGAQVGQVLDVIRHKRRIRHSRTGLRARIVARLGWLGLALASRDNDAGAIRIDGGSGPAIWNVAIDEERELAESALAWL